MCLEFTPYIEMIDCIRRFLGNIPRPASLFKIPSCGIVAYWFLLCLQKFSDGVQSIPGMPNV